MLADDDVERVPAASGACPSTVNGSYVTLGYTRAAHGSGLGWPWMGLGYLRAALTVAAFDGSGL